MTQGEQFEQEGTNTGLSLPPRQHPAPTTEAEAPDSPTTDLRNRCWPRRQSGSTLEPLHKLEALRLI